MTNDLTSEFARMMMIEYCPFGYLHTKVTQQKLENELEIIYKDYKDGENKIYIDSEIKENFYLEEEEEDDEEIEESRYDLKKSLINLCKILLGDDQKENDELEIFYNNDYFDNINENTSVLDTLSRIIIIYIYFKSKNIQNVFEKFEYMIGPEVHYIYKDIKNLDEWLNECFYIYNNVTGEIYNKEEFDISKIKKGEMITLYIKNSPPLPSQKDDKHTYINIIKIYLDGGKIDGFRLVPVKALKIIKYAINEEEVLEKVYHIFNNGNLKRVKEIEKQKIYNFIQNRKNKTDNVLINVTNINKDVINHIILDMIYQNFDKDSSILKVKLETNNEQLYDVISKISSSDDFLLIKSEIATYIQTALKLIDELKNTQDEDRGMYRYTKLKIASNIYKLLQTDKGIDFLKKYDKFKETIERKKLELLKDIRKGEEWFKEQLETFKII